MFHLHLSPLLLLACWLSAVAATETTHLRPNRALQGRQDVCPTTAPEPNSFCGLDKAVTCKYNYLKLPTVLDDGTCKGPYSCAAMYGCDCDVATQQWFCFAALAPECPNVRKPFKSCKPKN